jgi:AcrR family transcriptional regulator
MGVCAFGGGLGALSLLRAGDYTGCTRGCPLPRTLCRWKRAEYDPAMNDDSQRHALQPVTASKREAILRAALQVFAESGVNGVAVPEIAARAGVGTGTIYRYFDSKDALVNELFREQKQALALRLLDTLDERLEPRQGFRLFWERLLGFVREASGAYRFLELQDHRPYLDELSRQAEQALLAPLAERVRVLQQRGLFRAEVRPEVLMSLIWGAFVQLFKAERGGYLRLTSEDLAAACDACWALCQPPR